MRYEGKLYRPPSEADAYILQATIGCSWNHCTYCDMYRDKNFRVRALEESLEDLDLAASTYGKSIEKVFVADGDALILPIDHWLEILDRCHQLFPRLRRVSAYAMASNLLEKTPAELTVLRKAGLSLLYIGPESGDDVTLKRIAKGSSFSDHVQAAKRAHDAGMKISAIFLLGAGGIERSEVHARESARLATEMDPEFLAALTLTVIPETPLARQQERGKFERPDVEQLLNELRIFVAGANPCHSLFRTNHASNYLPIGGHLPRDRARILQVIDAARAGQIDLRPEDGRGL